jgi:hypothetical protein
MPQSTPRPDKTRKWNTSMCAIWGPIELTDEEIAGFAELWHSEDEAVAEAAWMVDSTPQAT